MQHRLHILGASGTGTTSLGRALAEALRIPAFDVDDYYWLPDPPYTIKRPVEERVALLTSALDPHPSWIVSGSMTGWGDALSDRFTLVVFLVAPLALRLERLRARETERFGADALAEGGWFHDNHAEFIAWASRYDDVDFTGRSRRQHESWLARLKRPALRLDATRSVEELRDEVLGIIEG